MQRYKVEVSYLGTNFFGWQKTPGKKTIQETIEDAIFKAYGKKERIPICVAGRTDSGVHSSGQVFHFDSECILDKEYLKKTINAILQKESIYIKKIELVNINFHARYSAIERVYVYTIALAREYFLFHPDSTFIKWLEPKHMDLLKREIIKFEGEHNFFSFCSTGDEKTLFVRTINSINFIEEGDNVKIFFKSKGFLYHQIRFMVGSALYAVKKNKNTLIEELLNSKDKIKKNLVLAPPSGLNLYRIIY